MGLRTHQNHSMLNSYTGERLIERSRFVKDYEDHGNYIILDSSNNNSQEKQKTNSSEIKMQNKSERT
jgi:hypothetical protein